MTSHRFPLRDSRKVLRYAEDLSAVQCVLPIERVIQSDKGGPVAAVEVAVSPLQHGMCPGHGVSVALV